MFSKASKIIYVFCLFVVCACSSSTGSEGEGGISDEDLALSQSRFGDGNIPKAGEDGMFKDVHFDYDSSSVKSEDQSTIKAAAKFLKENPSVQLELEGHCDKRGTSEYNMALGDRRAKSVATMVVSLGASAGQLSTISYGEEIPLDPADNEAAYAKNRRVHFTLYKKGKK